MLYDAPFPFPGCKAFLAGSADPVTVIRRNADGSALVRMDPRPRHRANLDATGNRTVAKDELHKTEEAAVQAGLASSSRAVGRKNAPKRRKARAAR